MGNLPEIRNLVSCINAMICHSYALLSFIQSSIIPIPKGTKATLTDSDKY